MSVINQMLKDLEARQRAGASPGAVQAALSGASRAGRGVPAGGGLLRALGIAGLVLLAGAVGAFLAWRAVEHTPDAVASALPVVATAVSPVTGEPAPTATERPAPVAAPAIASPPVAAPAAPPPDTAPIDTPRPAVEPTPSAPREAAPPVEETMPSPARQSIDRLPPPGDPLEGVRALLADGNATEALVRLDAAASSTPEARALRATALQALGRHREAIDEWTAALGRQADVAAWWVGLAISLEADGRAPEALAAYAQAGRHGPLEPALADYVRGRVDALSATTPR